jgi:hypothetical protein
MIRDFVARTTGAEAEIAPDVLLCQGVAAMIFLLGMATLQGLLWLPLAWRDGEFARLVGLLWAVPAAALMTAHHAAEKLDALSASRYSARMALARLGAIVLALVVFPVAQWHFVDGQPGWVTPALAMPVVVSFVLCLGVSVAAGRLGALWFQLPLHPSECRDRSCEWGGARPQVWIDRSAIVARFWRWWLAGALAMCGALAVHQYAPDRVGVPQFWGVLAFLTYLGLGPLLIGQAARVGRRAQWRLDGVVISSEVLEDWGARGLTLTALAVGGACLAAMAGLFSWLHSHTLRLAALLGLLQGPGRPSTAHGGPVQPSYAGTSGTGFWSGQPSGQAQGGWGFDLHIGLPIPPSFLLLLVVVATLGWSLVWARRHESHGIARWLLILCLADRLLAYLGWLRKAVPGWIATAGTLRAPAARGSGRQRSRPRGRTVAVAEPATPRQAIIARYLSSLEHAARRGYPRRPGQTPHQFAVDLRAGLRRERDVPEAMADLFTAARYSPRPCGDRDAARMDQLWRVVRRKLRRH